MIKKCLNKSSDFIKDLLLEIKSEPALAKVLDTFDDDYNPTKEEVLAKYKEMKDSKKIIDQKESEFERVSVFFKRRIATLNKQADKFMENTPEYDSKISEANEIEAKLLKANEEQSGILFTELGNEMLDKAEQYIDIVANNPSKANKDNLLYAVDILSTMYDFDTLATRSRQLFKKAFPIIIKHNLKTINDFATEGFEITEDMINDQTSDIGSFTKWTGALADLGNYIARTIGSIIKTAQNRASTKNKVFRDSVQEHVDELAKYAKSQGKTLEDMYNLLIEETDKNLRLIPAFIHVDGKKHSNPAFDKIKNSKELLKFYVFYQNSLRIAETNLPYKVGKHYIPNIYKTDIKYKLTHLLDSHDVLTDNFKSNEDLYADIVPEKFRMRVPKDKKSKDLGASLLEFVAYSNSYNELSQALPEVRLLQQQIKWKRLSDGGVKEREFTKSSQPNVRIFAEATNLWKMVDTIIDMQLKGRMSKDEGEIKGKAIKNAEGETVGYKAKYWSDVFDLGLKYNSMLRIGFSPITALANVLFGDVSNSIEAIGGRFFTLGDLAKASNVFFKQVDYTGNNKKNDLHEWLEKLNPLQELDDYNLGDSVKLNKMSAEKLQEYMYGMQKKGELFLQSRTMIAVLIHEGYMTSDGKTTDKGKALTEKQLEQLSDKIQRLNQMIHGRYSRREAASLQQSVLYRAAIQFRKWIPSAIEARVAKKQYDNRLGVDIEGRYRTFYNLLKELKENQGKLKDGRKLTELEIYNMKKNTTEILLLTATLVSYLALFGGDDEEDKKRRKNPYVKVMLTMLDRISGDLLFFYNPQNINNMALNAIPLAKTTGDLYKVIENLPAAFYYGEYKYDKGSMKGHNKFYTNLRKVLIGAKPLQDIYKLFNENPIEAHK